MSPKTPEIGQFASIKIIGAGLIGTSIGLALANKGVSVSMSDIDPKAAKLANDLVASASAASPELILYAGPSSGLKSTLESEFKVNSRVKFIDIGSVKTKSLLEVSQSSLPTRQFLGTHPMAGREVGGAQSARADLFQSRSWIYMPADLDGVPVDPDLVAAGLWLIQTLGASPVAMTAEEHDRAVALVSHLPQVAASLLAAQLRKAEPESLDLAGAGLRDTTRIAASNAALWDEILNSNSNELLPLLINLQSDLATFIQRLSSSDSVSDLIEAGNQGRSKIPGKHGGAAREYSLLPVVIEDKPGQLAALFDECAKAKVNVEDLTIEHSPGQFTGLITLALSAKDAQVLQDHLTKSGWSVHAPR
jgi:prephenate dehydrogenase